jgi:hypothetical protein
VLHHFRNGVHWSFMQVEYATDVVFRQQARFQPLYVRVGRVSEGIRWDFDQIQ